MTRVPDQPPRGPTTREAGSRQDAGGVAHALKNQLSIIMGFAELLAQELDPQDPHLADVREIQTAAREARAIVDRTLVDERNGDAETP